ncbi:sortase domain-containing protein [Streptomyces sp. NBC_01429]|uniref:sortase domain-containing protein n=1 Tax=Streptomyces sp. NBC_01429 TaxID=2903862 RepID=UPI002E2CB33F|nr:sortase [Streptomyces sp. NBC_01429]
MKQGPHRARRDGRRTLWTAVAALCALAGSVAIGVAVADQTPPPPRAAVAGTVPPRTPADRPGQAEPPGMPRSVPVEVAIPEARLAARLQPVRTTGRGELPLPADPARASWLASSVTPGERGTAVLAGHVDSADGPAAFYGLGAVTPGMAVTVRRADGSTARFTVAAVAVYPKDRFPDSVYAPTASAGLRMITCTGWDRAARTYRDNVVVYATAATERHRTPEK